jgi:hypothetical protein
MTPHSFGEEEITMYGELNYRLSNEHIADLRRAADQQRFAPFAKHESFYVRSLARMRRRQRPIADRVPARLSDAELTTRPTDAAAAEA